MQDEFIRLQSVLKRTIVFIAHGFDEAIRLADKIAIMKDGEVVQSGTPEDIVLSPATPYVAEFTRNVPKAKVVKVASIMKPAADAAGPSVPSTLTVAAAAPLFAAGAASLTVVDAAGQTVGRLDRADVVDLMMSG